METLRNLALPEVKKLASVLASHLKSQGAVIGLTGNLGSGKTTFAKAFLKKLGINEGKSPTFVISHQYRQNSRLVCHLDFYRLNREADLRPLGMAELMSGRNIVIMEWVDKFPKIKKHCDIVISFKIKRLNKRDVIIQFN